MKKTVGSLMGLILGLVLLTSASVAAQLMPTNPPANVTLAWDASTDATVGSYKVYYGVGSRVYTNLVVVSGRGTTTLTITNLTRGTLFYFAATCVATNGLESPFSNEVSYRPDTVPNPPVLRLTMSTSSAANRVRLVYGLGPEVTPVITGQGEPYGRFEVQRAVLLKDWVEIQTVYADGQGKFEVRDPAPPSLYAFYRANQT